MNKKGFTLIELMAVILILGVILAIFIPNAIKILKENNIKIYKVKEETLVKSAKDYVMYNRDFEIPNGSSYAYITSNTLIKSGFGTKILDTTSGNECNAFVRISVNNVSGYNYEACLLCEEYKTNKDFCTSSTFENI